MFVTLLCLLLSSCATFGQMPFALPHHAEAIEQTIAQDMESAPVEFSQEEESQARDGVFFIDVPRPLPAPIDFSAFVYGEDWHRPEAEEAIVTEEVTEPEEWFDPKAELLEQNNIVLILIIVHVMLISIVFGAVSAKRAWRYRRILRNHLDRKD